MTFSSVTTMTLDALSASSVAVSISGAPFPSSTTYERSPRAAPRSCPRGRASRSRARAPAASSVRRDRAVALAVTWWRSASMSFTRSSWERAPSAGARCRARRRARVDGLGRGGQRDDGGGLERGVPDARHRDRRRRTSTRTPSGGGITSTSRSRNCASPALKTSPTGFAAASSMSASVSMNGSRALRDELAHRRLAGGHEPAGDDGLHR